MPDILIRGMEMPTEGGAIGIYKISGNFYAARVGKDELFPLVELPPHGDLIDMDKIQYTELHGGVEVTTANWIDSLPVVVPAERSEP